MSSYNLTQPQKRSSDANRPHSFQNLGFTPDGGTGNPLKEVPGQTLGPTDVVVHNIGPSGLVEVQMKRQSHMMEAQKQRSAKEEDAWFDWVRRQFEKHASSDGVITRDKFITAFSSKPHETFFAERLFSLIDQDHSGAIDQQELVTGLQTMNRGTPQEKLRLMFDVYDMDGNGLIEPAELREVLRSCVEESSMHVSEEDLNLMTNVFMEMADKDASGAITFQQLLEELERHPDIFENLTIGVNNWLHPPKKQRNWRAPECCSMRYLRNNMPYVVFVALYLVVQLALTALSIYRYWDANSAIIVARCCGMCLNFNSAFVFLFMLRRVLTWLRCTRAAAYLPLDQSILLHKEVGGLIIVQSVIHTWAHLVNIGIVDVHVSDSWEHGMEPSHNHTRHELWEIPHWQWLLTPKSGLGWTGDGLAFLTGVLLDIVLMVMGVCSANFVRRYGYFQVFYWTHQLYIIFIVLCILHGKLMWMFMIGPVTIFLIERISRLHIFQVARYGQMHIKGVNLLPSKVTQLIIRRPAKFSFKPGDYVFVNIPEIATYEYHPITISSAPERSDMIWLHIRSAGNWTNRVYDHFANYMDDTSEVAADNGMISELNQSVATRRPSVMAVRLARKVEEVQLRVNLKVNLDGPFGTSTREIFEAEHAVLIASGIGVTPYASILQSIVSRYIATRQKCPQCSYAWVDPSAWVDQKLNKVDFIWINRDQTHFEWFVSLLAQLELEGSRDEEFNNFLEMQMFMTSAHGKNDMKGIGLQMAMEMLHQKGMRDVLTGLKTRTQPGRPNWHEIFTKLKLQGKGKVKIFFCGSPSLAKVIKENADRFGFHFSKENF